MSQLAEISHALHILNVNFETVNDMPLNDPLHIPVAGVLLEQVGRRWLAVVPADAMITIPGLKQTLNGRVTPVESPYQNKLQQPATISFPPLAHLYRAKLLVDERLRQGEYYYHTLDDGHTIRFDSTNWRILTEQATWGDFCCSLFDNPTNHLGLTHYNPATLQAHIEEQHEFPVMSATAQKILKLQADPYAEVEDLAAIVERSPSLAAQVVKWANSPYYGFPGGVATVEDAIIKVLGFDLVLNLALGLAIGDKFKLPLEGPVGLQSYWAHSLYTAALVEKIVVCMSDIRARPSLGIAYLSGLLHNFGYLLMGQILPQHFQAINAHIPYNPHLTYREVEHIIVGVSHDVLGFWLMENWHMPAPVLQSNLHHHDEGICSEEATIVGLVNTATCLLKSLGVGDADNSRPNPEILKSLGVNAEKLDLIIQDFAEHTADLNEICYQLVKAAD